MKKNQKSHKQLSLTFDGQIQSQYLAKATKEVHHEECISSIRDNVVSFDAKEAARAKFISSVLQDVQQNMVIVSDK